MTQRNPQHQANYQQFIDEVRTNNQLWGLQFGEEWVVCDSNDFADTDVLPLWSNEAAAKTHCVDEWHDYTPVSIDLESFFEEWVNDLSADDVLIGINWDEQLDGIEIEPIELAHELAQFE